MKHKKYEEWILEEPVLNARQERELLDHLLSCHRCYLLSINWQASKQLLEQAVFKTPYPGFTQRWQNSLQKKHRREKILRYRLTLLGLIALAFMGSLVYIIASGDFLKIMTNTLTEVIRLLVAITHGLSEIGILVNTLPRFVPISIGLITFGLFNAFIMTGLFTWWNLKYRRLHSNESPNH